MEITLDGWMGITIVLFFVGLIFAIATQSQAAGVAAFLSCLTSTALGITVLVKKTQPTDKQ